MDWNDADDFDEDEFADLYADEDEAAPHPTPTFDDSQYTTALPHLTPQQRAELRDAELHLRVDEAHALLHLAA